MADYESVFGETLLSKNGEVPVSTLNGKYVGVYFSAHWCGNCRQFTPKLRKAYLELKKQNAAFEIVFCSADKDIKGFQEYFGSMPWLAVSFENDEVKQNLNNLFQVSGIPHFVMLSPEGVINPNARGDVESTGAAGFPWKQPSIKELIAPHLKKGDASLEVSALDNKYFGLYFSAHWCGPCKKFTPKLIEAYNQLKKDNKDFEVVFCSLDNDPDQYKEYYGSMPWLSIGYECPILSKLKEICGVEGIPALILCGPDGEPFTSEGRNAVETTGAAGFPWMPAALKDLNQEPDDINEKACLVLFMDKDCCDEATKNANIEVLTQVAEAMRGTVSFFYVKESGDVSDQIRGMLQSDACPLLSIINIPDNGGYYIADNAEITAENVANFVNGCLNGTVERKQMVA